MPDALQADSGRKPEPDLIVPLAVCFCSGVFVALLDTQRCCSTECRQAWEEVHHKEPPAPKVVHVTFRPCAFCTTWFVVKHAHDRFCSVQCKSLFHNNYTRHGVLPE
jgi:hypothetical protein